jgi:hypothetical protein
VSAPPRRRRAGRAALAALLAAVLLAGCDAASAPSAAPPSAPAPAGPPVAAPPRPQSLAPERGALFGAYVADSEDYTPASVQRAITDLEATLGRRLDLTHAFYPWDRPFPTWREEWSLERGQIPLISWNGTYTDQIVRGEHDALIRERADGVKALGERVIIRWFWEMDGRKKADRAVSPDSYIAAWRHLRRLFAEQGATNVEWAWCPNAWSARGGRAQLFYPGDEHVDWLCADGYNWAPTKDGAPWQSFEEVFADFYDWAAPRGKPIMIGETGAQERAPGEKGAWQGQAHAALKERFPLVRAYVHFDAIDYVQDYDWRVDTSASSLEAFVAMARDPYFNPRRDGRRGGGPLGAGRPRRSPR